MDWGGGGWERVGRGVKGSEFGIIAYFYCYSCCPPHHFCSHITEGVMYSWMRGGVVALRILLVFWGFEVQKAYN